jgi:hypothetical protein
MLSRTVRSLGRLNVRLVGISQRRKRTVIVIANDDRRKMLERHAVEPFLAEYAYITGVELTLVGAGERPDFVCQQRGRHFGLELVKVMQDPVQRRWDLIFGGDGHLHGLEAAILVQDKVYAKDRKRASPGWRYPESTILVIQLIGSDAEEMTGHLDDQLVDEMAETGFREIWIADYSPMESYGTVQLTGVKPQPWRGVHPHRFSETKPYG